MISFRKLVMPQDLNPANRLFGGKMMAFADEAMALYAFCQLDTPHVVTYKISEILFTEPVFQGDFLLFDCTATKFGITSMQVHCSVATKAFGGRPARHVFSCTAVFVAIDPETGKKVPHGKTAERVERLPHDCYDCIVKDRALSRAKDVVEAARLQNNNWHSPLVTERLAAYDACPKPETNR